MKKSEIKVHRKSESESETNKLRINFKKSKKWENETKITRAKETEKIREGEGGRVNERNKSIKVKKQLKI